jgi:hypothetical protein
VPQSIALPLPSASGADRTLVSDDMIRSSGTLLTLPALGAVDDTPLFKYAITTSEVGYYVLPAFNRGTAPTAAQLSADYDVATLKGITHMVVFKEAVPGTRDVGSGFASMPSGYDNSAASAITIWGATVTNDIPFLVLDVLTGDVFYQDNTNTALNRLAFVDDKQAVNDFTFTLVSRILLSTDTDASTFQVNSSKVTREVTIFSNPVFADTSLVTNILTSGKSIIVSIENAEFVQRKLDVSDFVFDADTPTTGFAVTRTSNTTAIITGLSGLSGTSGLQVASKALVARGASAPVLVASGSNQLGIATVGSKALVLTSGTTLGVDSGFTFTVTLSNDVFITSGAAFHTSGITASGVDLIDKGVITSFTIGGNDATGSGLTLHNIDGEAKRSDAGQKTLIFELRGAVTDLVHLVNQGPLEIGITFNSDVLKTGTVDLAVLTSSEAELLTANPKLSIAVKDAS